jgi:hypothetical protein
MIACQNCALDDRVAWIDVPTTHINIISTMALCILCRAALARWDWATLLARKQWCEAGHPATCS